MADKKPTPRIQAFLAAIRVDPSITHAAKAAGISREAHYRRYERDAAYRPIFDKAFRQGIDALEDEAIRRAKRGVKSVILYHGQPVMMLIDPNDPSKGMTPLLKTEYSDQLLIRLLEAKKPDEYKQRVQNEHTGSIDIVERLAAGRKRLAKRNAKDPGMERR
jgi:hypothetical protein